jgi:putative endopeptidase
MPNERRTRKSQKPRQNEAVACAFADDFYGVRNGRWVTQTNIPATETRVTQAYFIRTGIERELNETIDRMLRTEPTGNVARLLRSWDATTKQPVPHSLTALLHLMTTVDTPADIAARIGWMNRHGIGAPLNVYVMGDPRDQRNCRIMIEEGEPRIGIPEYWTWSEYAGHRKAYHAYVRRIATVLRMPHLETGWGAEKEFAEVYPTAMERRRRMDSLTWVELASKYTGVDWHAMLSAWGLRDEQIRSMRYIVSSGPFIHHMSARIRGWPIDKWRSWLGLTMAQWIAGISPHGPLRSAWFTYARRYLQGMIHDVSPRELRYTVVRAFMANTLGRRWVRDHCDPQLKRDMLVMIENVRNAAAHQLGNCSWMSPSTREAAVRKLRRMDIQVCWPDQWPSHELVCGLDDADFVANLLRLNSAATDMNIQLAKRGDCRHPLGRGWGRPVFEVNAFYYPTENRFLLPAAILRPPFYDPRKSLVANYGGIGATIGHELCHAFDAEGRGYDAEGNKRNWWTERDDKEYRKRAAGVVRLYESRDYRGMEVDGSLTLVENIADIGGLEFALAGAKKALGRPLTKEELREFFDSFAISWRSKDRLARAEQLLATDSHAPPMLRVNHAVRQLDAWYDAYGIGADCEEFIPPAERIRFFA